MRRSVPEAPLNWGALSSIPSPVPQIALMEFRVFIRSSVAAAPAGGSPIKTALFLFAIVCSAGEARSPLAAGIASH